MTDNRNTISFEIESKLYEELSTAARNERLSIEDYLRRVVYEHIHPGAKRRREYHTPRRFYCYEVDPD